MTYSYNTSFDQWQKKGQPSGYSSNKFLKISAKIKKILHPNNFKLLAFCILFLLAIIVYESKSDSYIIIITSKLRSNINKYVFSFYNFISYIKKFFSSYFHLKRILDIFFGTIIWRSTNGFINFVVIRSANLFKKF